MRIKHITVCLLIVAVLSGCSQGISTGQEIESPAPIAVVDSEVETTESAENISFSAGDETPPPTDTPQPTQNAEPTATVTPAQTQGKSSSSEESATPKPTASPKPVATPKPTASSKPTETAKPTATPKPSATPKPTPVPTPESTPTPAPAETPKPEDDMKVEGSSYGNKVLVGVNEVREQNGCAPLTYGGSGSLMDRCKEMAKSGTLKAPSGSNESTSKSNDGGKTMGIFSAVHASGIGSGDYTTLYVASVVYNGTRWTIVRAS